MSANAVMLFAGLLMQAPTPLAPIDTPAGADPNEATKCIVINDVRSTYTYVTNTCPFPLQVVYCSEGGGMNQCSTGNFVTEARSASSGPAPFVQGYGGNGITLHWIACKHPYSVDEPRWNGSNIESKGCVW